MRELENGSPCIDLETLMMHYWLIKSEPGTWSWEDHCQSPDQTAEWDGVRNYQAANNMKAMRLGDRAFFYHSVKEKAIQGIVKVVREYYPDPTDPKGRFGMVDFQVVTSLNQPVTLAQIKATPCLDQMVLVRNSRLSVQPVTAEAWQVICRMGGVDSA